MKQLNLQDGAAADIRAAAHWYEDEWAGLGAVFLDEVEETLSRVAVNPLIYQELFGGVRRALVRRFPYGLYFIFEEDVIKIFAVLHLHREPDAWKGRLT